MIRTISGFSVRRPWVVIVLWLAVVGAGFGVGIGVFEKLTSEIGSVPGSESSLAEQRLERAAPRPETIAALIPGRPAADPALKGSLDAVRAVPGVAEVSEPLPSARAGGPLLVEISLAPGDGQEDAAEDAAGKLAAVGATVSGGPLSDAEYDEQAQSDVARAEMLSMPVVLVLLLVFFGGLLAAGLPLLIAIAGAGATFAILYAFSAVTDISVYSVQIVTMLAVGLAVDYALLMVSRFKEERRTAPDVRTAVTRTTATAGRTVMFSGLTVAVAMAGLTVFPDPFLRSMGLAGAAVVVVDMAAALTLLPALLSRFGHRIKPAKRGEGPAVFARVARAVQRRPVLTLVVAGGMMVTLALPLFGMRISEGDPKMLPPSSTTREMWDQLNAHFPEQARGGDIQIVADAPAGDPRVASFGRDVAALPGIAEVRMEQAGPGATAMMATPRGSAEGPAARAAVESIRDLQAPFGVAVTGDTAKLADYKAMLVDRLPWAVAIVAIGTMLLLFAFTGSVLLPVKAVLTNLLSIGAALGVVVWVFQDGHLAGLFGTEGAGYLHLTVPVLVGAIAFGLSVDYEVFLLSRIRERWLAGAGPRESVAEGLQHTGGIVTAAALVIGVVFAAFALGGFAPIKALGLGLALAVALDATVVRMLLVPATMTLLGRYNWWLPQPLRRVHTRLAVAH